MSLTTQGFIFAIPLFCVATMLTMGLETKLEDTVAPLRNMLALVTIIFVNNILVPLLGAIIVLLPELLAGGPLGGFMQFLIPLNPAQQFGFVVMCLAAGSVAAPAFAGIAGATPAFARGIMVALVVATTLLLPVEIELLRRLVPTAVPITETMPIFSLLLRFQLLPLIIGVLIKSMYEPVADRLRPFVSQLAASAFIILVGLALAATMTRSGGLSEFLGAVTIDTDIARIEQIAQIEQQPQDLLVTFIGDVPDEDPPTSLVQTLTDAGTTLPSRTQVIRLNQAAASAEDGARWAVVNPDTAYRVKTAADELHAVDDTFSNGAVTLPLSGRAAVSQEVQSLTRGAISTDLRQAFAAIQPDAFVDQANAKSTVLLANLVLDTANPDEWILVTDRDTFLTTVDGNTLNVTQVVAEPLGIVSSALGAAEEFPVVGPLIEILKQFIAVVWPYIMMLAIAAIIMIVGYYGGVAVRNIVGATGSGIPRTMASSTALRNVSFALIVIIWHVLSSGAANLHVDAINAVLVFYVASLAVAAHKSVQWGRMEESEDSPLEDLAAELAKDIGILGASD